MKRKIVGYDLAKGQDMTVETIYDAYGLTKEQVETKENTELLNQFIKVNSIIKVE